jgi:hypothetical protein
MRNTARQTRANRTIPVDFHHAATEAQLPVFRAMKEDSHWS